ncbi:MAG: 1-acyl-sn-glycerol-3-phosphate acyltransferase [Lentisphaerae bacterium]|nr:1-acyl-sn-glycerol-3-phosphate acyltransferase [Lentisphaerota bacterium]
MNPVLRFLFFGVLARFVALIVLGLNVRHRERLPRQGPALIVANHNSHLDTIVLMTLFPLRLLPRLRPVAAADYFLRGRLRSWFSTRVMGILPVARHPAPSQGDPLAEISAFLAGGGLVILFPEGTRGAGETLCEFKSGVAHLARRHPDVPVVPVYLHGLGKALPKGETLLVPFFCDVFVGPALRWAGEKQRFMDELGGQMRQLSEEGHFAPWA